ncbi:hypothetical protein V8F33_002116 [Rhypophila sp. PSN 637]
MYQRIAIQVPTVALSLFLAPTSLLMAPKALVLFAITVAPNFLSEHVVDSCLSLGHGKLRNKCNAVTSFLKTYLLRCSRLEVRLGSAVGISYSPRQAESTRQSETDAQGNLIEGSTFIQLTSFPRTPES